MMSRATVSRGSEYSAVRTVFCSRSLSAAGGDAGRDPGVAGGASASASPAATDAVDSTDGGRAATGEAGLGRVGDPTGAGVGGASPGAVGSRLMASMLSPTAKGLPGTSEQSSSTMCTSRTRSRRLSASLSVCRVRKE